MFLDQKIYFNNKPLILTNAAIRYLDVFPASAGYLHLTGAFPRNLRLAQSHLKKLGSLGVIIEDIDWELFKPLLDSYFTPITAAGGVVTAPGNKTLMIFRRGKWDLPKGKLDEGESIEDCALREVIEETGLPDAITLGEEICRTYHVYTHGDKDALKTTYWYRMIVEKDWTLIPQQEENISEAEWVAEAQISGHLRNAWKAVAEVLELAGKNAR